MDFRYYFITPKIYPIFCLTASLIAGIWWQSHNPSCYLSVSVGLVIASLLIVIRNKSITTTPLYVLFYLGAFLVGCFNYHRITVKQQIFCSQTDGKNFDITGTVKDIHQTTNPHLRYTIKLNIKQIVSCKDQSCYYCGNISINLYTRSLHGIHIADTILIKNVLLKTPKNTEFMGFLLKENIITSASITQSLPVLIYRPPFSLSRWLGEYKNNLLYNFRQDMDKETFLAFSSIFLGNPLAKKKEDTLKNQLKRWGLFHYIARAGLHLMIFVSIWVFIFGLLPAPWVIRQIFIIILCIFYFLFTWSSIPFNRAFFTFLFVKTCALIRIKTYYIPSLSFITFVTLLENPVALFALDFQLSFGVTFALAWLNEIRAQYRSY